MKIYTKNKVLSLNTVNSAISVLTFLFLIMSQVSFAQTRVIVNPGLEFGVANNTTTQIDSNFGLDATFDAGAPATSPWYTSHPTQTGGCNIIGPGNCHPIEVWGTGALGVASAQGSNFVELNAYVSSMIYQNMYLVNGDIITFSFRHRARDNGNERAAMVIEDQNQNNIATVLQTAATSSTTAWSTNAGTYPFTGTSGVYRVGFRATVTNSPGAGNLLDDIRITLNPLIDLKYTNALVSCEGSSNGNLFLRINGAVTAPTTVAVQLINPANGTAFISDSDITVTGVANSHGTPTVSHTPGSTFYLITIPLGNYDGGATPGYLSPSNDEDGISLNIASVNDGVTEPTETFKFEIKQQGTNGSTNNFVSTSAPIFGDTYYGSTSNYYINSCPDTDGDGIADSLDLDDDNDGILDTVEGYCSSQTVYTMNLASTLAGATFAANGGSFNLVYTLTSGTAVASLGNSFTVPFSYSDFNNSVNTQNHTWASFGTSANSFLIVPNGTSLFTGLPANNTTSEDPSGAVPASPDGWFRYFLNTNRISQLGTFTTTIGSLPTVSSLSSYSSNPDLNLFSSFNASSSTLIDSGYHAKMQLQNAINTGNVGATLPLLVTYGNTYNWDYTAFSNTPGSGVGVAGRGLITISQNTITFCNHRDTDGDGIPDYLDLDSDNDGCFDSVEGDESVTKAQLNTNGSIAGAVNANGVPTLVNTAGAADVGSDVGQGLGSSQNAAIQDVECSTVIGCTNALYLAQFDTLYSVNMSSNPFAYPSVGVNQAGNYNAIGINPLDGRMYGMLSVSSNNLLVINANGSSINLGPITGLPAASYNSGEIDNLGNYYLKAPGANALLYRVNLTTLTATLITLNTSISVSDLAFRTTDGLLYSVKNDTGQLVSINPATSAVVGIGATPGAVAFGALFGSSTGEIFGADNAGGFYQFNITTGARVLISGSPVTTGNDGAHCVTSPITFSADLAVTKTDGTTTFASGTITTYTVIVTNNGPFGVLNATVEDPLPAGIPSANVSYTAVASSGSDTAVSGTQTGAINDLVALAVNGTVTYTVVVSIPVAFSGDLVNTATVTAPTNITETNITNNTATDTDIQLVCYRPVVTAGTVLTTNHGITSLNRAGNSLSAGNWPMVRKGAWTALESKTKGFVLNRLTTAQITAIPAADLVEGMTVYNVTLDCLQVNSTGTAAGWACFNTQTCPTN